MKLHNFLIGVALFSLVVVVMLAGTANIVDNYAMMGIDIDINENQSAAFDKASTINSKAQSIESSMSGTDVGGEDSDTTFLGGAWSFVQIVFNSLGLATSLVKETGNVIPIPTAIITFIISAIIITVMATAAYMLFKHTGE